MIIAATMSALFLRNKFPLQVDVLQHLQSNKNPQFNDFSNSSRYDNQQSQLQVIARMSFCSMQLLDLERSSSYWGKKSPVSSSITALYPKVQHLTSLLHRICNTSDHQVLQFCSNFPQIQTLQQEHKDYIAQSSNQKALDLQ